MGVERRLEGARRPAGVEGKDWADARGVHGGMGTGGPRRRPGCA